MLAMCPAKGGEERDTAPGEDHHFVFRRFVPHHSHSHRPPLMVLLLRDPEAQHQRNQPNSDRERPRCCRWYVESKAGVCFWPSSAPLIPPHHHSLNAPIHPLGTVSSNNPREQEDIAGAWEEGLQFALPVALGQGCLSPAAMGYRSAPPLPSLADGSSSFCPLLCLPRRPQDLQAEARAAT